jgi:hypothetical protein
LFLFVSIFIRFFVFPELFEVFLLNRGILPLGSQIVVGKIHPRGKILLRPVWILGIEFHSNKDLFVSLHFEESEFN